MIPARPPLFTFRFLALCLFMLLAYCNISVFYNLYPYLETLGVPQQLRGPIIGSSSLATIAGFLLFTPRQSEKNAPWAIFIGIALLILCGVGYLFERDVPGLFALRLINGVGIALMTGSATTLLVAHIAPERSGQAFGVYSVAALVPYSIVPSLFDHIGPYLPSPAWGYAGMSLALVPAAVINLLLLRQSRGKTARGAGAGRGAGYPAMLASLRTRKTSLMLLTNAVYYLNFSALFFLSKSLFASRGLGNVGLFFSIQTALMILIRVFASRLFDEVKKPLLILWCYGLTALGFGMLWLTHDQVMVTATALVLGLGMGVGPPSLNALMYALSEDKLKAVNSNLMVMALQAGNFLGPILGGVAVGVIGYHGFLAVGLAANVGGMWLAVKFLRWGWTGEALRANA
jgi:MFS family permease